MSRSRRHTPISKDNQRGGAKKGKRFANKKVRHAKFEDLPRKGKQYKKLYCSYDIHDWISRWTWEEALQWYNLKKEDSWIKKEYPTQKDFYHYWYKTMIMK